MARSWALVSLLGLGVVFSGCATRGLPPDEAATPITIEALRRTEKMYLYPERMDRRMLVGALDALENRFDSVRFDEADGSGLLAVGESRVEVPVEEGFDSERYRKVLSRSLHFVGAHLEEPLENNETLEVIALRGALSALDRYSTVFSGRGTDDFKIRFSGKLHGIGSQIGRRDGQLIALKVFPDSPAERGGLKDGDAIVAIDGDPTRPLSVAEAVDRIRGEADTKIVLGVMRGEEKQDLDLHITRGEVVVPSVEAKPLGDGIGYARIFQVSRTTAAEFSEKTLALGEIEGLVLDLRGNTGGSMQAAAGLADQFLSRQLIIRVVNRDGEAASQHSRRVAGASVLFPVDVVILVDGQTASAAEILSGAMAPLGSVTLVGQTTFGKGLIQQVMQLPEENLLKLTVAEYLLSGDRAIHGKGIEPDVVLYPVSDTRLGRLAEVPEAAVPYVRVTGEDDNFPVEFAKSLLLTGREEALVVARKSSVEGINGRLADYGVAWDTIGHPAAPALPEPLEIMGEGLSVSAGQPSELRIRVRNPNDFPLNEAWAALRAPVDYLSNKLISLDAIPALGEVSGVFEITPPHGLTAQEHPLTVLVASGSRPVASKQLVLQVDGHLPDIGIVVTRIDGEQLEVEVTNRGQHGIGALRIGVPGATRSLEGLAAGASESVQLPLTEEPKEVAVTLAGPWAMRRIAVPIPETKVSVVPPSVAVDRGGLPGRPQLRLRANAPEGLHEGWIRMDGQKAAYVGWNGSRDGTLQSPLGEGDHDLTIKVETLSGVSILDALHITGSD